MTLPLRWKHWRAPTLVFGVALALRWGFVLEFRSSPFFRFAGLDSTEYAGMAEGILQGLWPGPYVFQRPPLYPALLSLLYATLGRDLMVLRLAHAALGAVTALLAYRIGRRLFASRLVATIAGLLCATNGTLIYLDSQLLPTALEGLLLSGMVLLFLRAGAEGGRKATTLAGILLGASILNRGASLLLVPMLAGWIFATTRLGWPVGVGGAKDDAVSRRFLPTLTAAILPAVVAISLTSIHNARYDVMPTPVEAGAAIQTRSVASRLASGRFLAISSNSGLNFFLGNHTDARGRNDPNHPDHFRMYASADFEALRQAGFSAAARSRFLVEETLQDLARHRGPALRLLATKTAQSINGVEIARNSNLYGQRRFSRILSTTLWKSGIGFPNGIVLPLALVGFFLARGSMKSWSLVPLVCAGTWATMLLFFVTARYRAPVLPLLCVFAAYALGRLGERIRCGDLRNAFPHLAGWTLLVVLCNLPVSPYYATPGAYERINLGFDLLEHGDLPAGIDQLERAVEQDPESAHALGSLARGRKLQGRVEEALSLYADAIRLEPDNVAIRIDLAITLAVIGRFSDAERQFESALRLDPQNAEARANRAILYWRQERPDDAIRDLEQALADYPRSLTAFENLGAILEATGQTARARKLYEDWLQTYPGDPRARAGLDRVNRD